MKTPIRMTIATALSVAAIAFSAVAGANAGATDPYDPSNPQVPGASDIPGIGGGMPAAACTKDHPDCNDTGLGGGSIDPSPQIVEPRPGMADLYTRPFDQATPSPDGRTIAISFVSGVEPCYVLDHVDVVETADSVTITLFEGHDPSAGDVACIEIGVFKQTNVTLGAPLGDRTIVDGAA